jgi:uncharacterized protein (DUF58 family)
MRKSLVALVVLSLLAVAPVALATTSTGSQNPDLAVTSSLTSNGPNPDRATTGDTVTAAGSVRNNTATSQSVRVTVMLRYPDGVVFRYVEQVTLAPGQTLARSYAYQVSSDDPRGTYRLTVSARNPRGFSRATSRITVF